MPRARPTDADPEDEFNVEDDWERRTESDEDDDELEDAAFQGDEGDDEGETETVACPNCGESVYEFADFCPACGNAIAAGVRPPSRRAWVVAAVLIGLTLVAMFLLF